MYNIIVKNLREYEMKKLLAVLCCLIFSAVSFAQDSKKNTVNKDAGNATTGSYTNSTYNINLNLPSADWRIVKNKMSLLSTNGKVVEYWSLKKDIRVVVTIEETTRRVIDIAQAKIADTVYAFRRLKVIKEKTFFPRGSYLVYYQEMQGEKATGARYKIKNYIMMPRKNRGVKISLFIIAPLNRAYRERFFIGKIWKNFVVR